MANYELSKIAYKGNSYTIKDKSALHQDSIGSWMPDFAKLKPISTHEFDISSTSYYKICERPNVAAIKDIADEVLAFRITVTGTNIFAITDLVARMQPTVNTYPRGVMWVQSQSTSVATTGIRYVRTVFPKAANTTYTYEFALSAYNTTARHIKIEVFKAPSAWTFFDAATVYSFNSTYQSYQDWTSYANTGLSFYGGTAYGTYNYANNAGYKSGWDGLFNGQGNFINAGAAIAANQFVFIGKDNKVYPTTSTSVEIDPAWPIVYCTTAYATNNVISWTALRSWGYFTPASSIGKDTLVAGDTVYMRCTYTNGKLYSANTMTHTLTAGNTYIKLGKMYTATAVSVNAYNSEYFTLDTYGSLTVLKALNGYLIEAAKADTASTVSKGGSTAAGTYGVLFDNNPITSVVPTNTSPRVNNKLTFDPSTGNLSSGIFTGSGAGLTGIPSSGVEFGDLPVIGDYEGPSGTGRFVTFLQNETGDTYTHPYLLEAPDAMLYRVGTDSVAFTNGVGLRRYKIGVYGARYSNTNNTSTFWVTCLKTPIEVDPSTHIPTNSLIVDGTKMTFRLYGDVTYADNTSDYFDTYFTLCYDGSGNWSVYYETKGDIHYGASVTFYKDRASVAIGWAYNESTYNNHLQNFKVYRYVDITVDHLGSTLGYAAGTSDYCKLIEKKSEWTAVTWQGNASESWSDVLSQVYATGRIEGIRADSGNFELFSKYVSEKTDATFAYTASGLAFSNSALTIPIDGTKYKILQMTVFNKDLSLGLGFPRLFIFDAAGSVGYIEGTSTYCTTTSAASGITAAFDSSWSMLSSTNIEIVVLYRRIS